MGTTAPWRFSNYMGEFASDADVATALSALGFSASSGMVYYNTTRQRHRFYRNGAWRDRLAPIESWLMATTPYIESNSTAWAVISRFAYEGTNVWTPSTFSVIGSRNGTSDAAEARLVRADTAVQLCLVSWTTSGVEIRTTTSFSSLPTGQTIIEVQHRKSTAGASRTRTHGFLLD